jgi:hypothetical protein
MDTKAAPDLETSLVIWGDRNAPASAIAQTAQAIEARTTTHI